MSKRLPLLKVKGRFITGQNGKKVFLRGVNLGGWLMMEGYFLHGHNFGEHIFKKEFSRRNSPAELKNFTQSYRQNFITEQDIQRIKKMGANCLRLPFNYRLLANDRAWNYLDQAIRWCHKAEVY